MASDSRAAVVTATIMADLCEFGRPGMLRRGHAVALWFAVPLARRFSDTGAGTQAELLRWPTTGA